MRPRTNKGPYPPCFYQKHGAFYLVRANKWTRLGTDLSLSLAEYGRLMEAQKVGGMPKLIEDWYGSLAGKSKSTLRQYRYAAEVLKRKLRQFEPGEVRASHVVDIRASMYATPNMANRVMGVLRLVFAYAVERHVVDTNPCAGVKRLAERRRVRLLTEAEWRAIHAKAGPRLQVIMELQYLTGQRINDVLKIRKSQLTDDGIVFEQQKTGAKLTVRWSPDLRRTVERAKALSADLPPTLTLLRGKYGKAPDYRSVALQWTEACKAAGVEDARLNDGRAVSATTAKKQGKDATALLGHSSPRMTERYLRDKEAPEVDGPSFRQSPDTRQKG